MEETLFKQILSLACRTAFYFSDKNYDENLEDVYFVFSFYILSWYVFIIVTRMPLYIYFVFYFEFFC